MACLNLFSCSYFASKNRYKQLCVNIWYEKKTLPLYGLNGRAVQLCEYFLDAFNLSEFRKWEQGNNNIEHFVFICFFPTEQRQKDTEDCLFQRIWLDVVNHRDVFYSMSGGRLLKLEGAELRVAHQEPPEPSSALVERFLGASVKRRRRSEEVNPSDPLRSQSHPSHPTTDHKDADHGQPDQDQTGAVSKETITSCDDPLQVLRPNGPVSPVKTNIADRAEQD